AAGNKIVSAMNFGLVAGDVERSKEGQALNMIPVSVCDEDVGADRQLFQQGLRQRKDTGTGIKDEQFARIAAHLDAGRVAAVARGMRTGRGNRATYAPETNHHAATFLRIILPRPGQNCMPRPRTYRDPRDWRSRPLDRSRNAAVQ